MRIRVVYMGALKDIAGKSSEFREIAGAASAGDVFASLQAELPAIERYARSLAMAVNHQFAGPSTPLKDGDELAFLPPVSGGSGEASAETPARRNAEIITVPIQTGVLARALKQPSDGALVIFEGIVRDNSRGRRTLFLDYEAYEPMATRGLESLVTGAKEKFAIRDAQIVHRIGRLEIGEASVVIIVASAHRGAAFDACRWMIDTMKKTVPIYKKENFEDGAIWADGEPFPPEIVHG